MVGNRIGMKLNTKDRSGDRNIVETTVQLNCLTNLTLIKLILDGRGE
jgi:hypothetical protein